MANQPIKGQKSTDHTLEMSTLCVYVESFVENLRGISLPKGIQFISIKRRNWLAHPVSCLWVAPNILLVPLTLLYENHTWSHKQELCSITVEHHGAKLCCSRSVRVHEVHVSPQCVSCGWLSTLKFIQILLGQREIYRERFPVSNKSQVLFQCNDLLTLLPLSS